MANRRGCVWNREREGRADGGGAHCHICADPAGPHPHPDTPPPSRARARGRTVGSLKKALFSVKSKPPELLCPGEERERRSHSERTFKQGEGLETDSSRGSAFTVFVGNGRSAPSPSSACPTGHRQAPPGTAGLGSLAFPPNPRQGSRHPGAAQHGRMRRMHQQGERDRRAKPRPLKTGPLLRP